MNAHNDDWNWSDHSFAENVERLAEANSVTKAEIGRIAGVTPSVVTNWAARDPSVVAVLRLARRYDVDPYDLMGTTASDPALEAALASCVWPTHIDRRLLLAIRTLLRAEALTLESPRPEAEWRVAIADLLHRLAPDWAAFPTPSEPDKPHRD